jgi:hypothetical protein
MTLKVGRAELEALASEKLKAEDFASKVRVVNRLETAGEPDAGARESALPRRPGR